ncbi:hypothetical protein [Telluribacter sp. SYSU D00476]|uniref:hypothetical protein n=1 Tax=Telluribacter sp. SYSU D00476 TaxID=2811430 RepID=UPI001FF1C331|nr:hypothetical protein [Telluribacter sp. SYSU D00476]
MRRYVFILLLFGVFVGCQDKEVDPDGTIETNARLVNNLPVDGCEWHFMITHDHHTSFYLPSKSTAYKVETIIATLPRSGGAITTRVRIRYRPTSQKGHVQCGFGRIAEYDEIDIIEIRKR